MTEQLQHAIERLQQLPIEEQHAMAERMLDELDEREWDTITSTSHVQQALMELADEAEQQEEAGETEADGFLLHETHAHEALSEAVCAASFTGARPGTSSLSAIERKSSSLKLTLETHSNATADLFGACRTKLPRRRYT